MPYEVCRLAAADILDWKSVASKIATNKHVTECGMKLNWNYVKWLRFTEGSDAMQVKYELDDTPFLVVNIRRATRGRKILDTNILQMLKPLYTKPVPISLAKYNDLQELCRKFVIPAEHHSFYRSLVHSNSERDALDEPDAEESDCEETV